MFWKLLPNLLTLIRLLAGLSFPWVSTFWWLPLVVYAAVSDLIDGWLSRRWQTGTAVGQMLDPIADKAFVLCALYSLWQQSWLSLPDLVWLASRDITVLVLTMIAAASTQLTTHDLKPRWSGKVATAAQFVVLVAIVYQQAPWQYGVIGGGFLSAVAAVDYGWTARRAWNSRSSGAAHA